MITPENASDVDMESSGLFYRAVENRIAESRAAGVLPPLLLLVHGRTGDASVVWGLTRGLEAIPMVAVAPQAFLADPEGGWSWWLEKIDGKRFNGSVPGHGAPEGVAIAGEQLMRFITYISGRYSIERGRIVAMGFSQGAILLGALSLLNPGLFKGVALLAGFIPEELFELTERNPVVSSPTSYFMAHGKADEIIPVSAAEATNNALIKRHASVEFVTDDVGHKIGSAGFKQLQSWLRRMLQQPS